MKTIEERIQEYVANAWVELDQFNEDHVTFENIVTSACVVGANFEYEELTRWRDPKEELPQNGQLVLCKTSDRNFHLSLLNMTVLNGGYMCIPDGLVLVIRLSAGGRFTKMSKMLCAF